MSPLSQRIKYLESLPQRAVGKCRLLLQGHLQCFKLALSIVKGKAGIEIGGPTDVFQNGRTTLRSYGLRTPLPIYDQVGSLDNCNFSSNTLWSTHQEAYHFSPRKAPGKNIIADGSDISSVSDCSYEFVLSSHNLEHFANPVKALIEWKRITRPNGSLILVLPDYRRSFDHHRTPTVVSHMIEDYARNIGEDDTTHIPEVLRLHDLEQDGTLKTHSLDELRARSTSNFSNRILHHHVFDEKNSVELLTRVGLEVLAVELALPHHIFILSRWKDCYSGSSPII
jgi:SAM-dependent methyltransferase